MNIRRQALRRRQLRNNRYVNSRTFIEVVFMKARALAFKRWVERIVEAQVKIHKLRLATLRAEPSLLLQLHTIGTNS